MSVQNSTEGGNSQRSSRLICGRWGLFRANSGVVRWNPSFFGVDLGSSPRPASCFFCHQSGLNNEASRRVAHELKGIARHECQGWLIRGIQNVDVVRSDDERLADPVAVQSIGGRELQWIADMNVTER